MGAFKEPHGGALKDLYLDDAAVEEAKQRARGWKSWDLTERQLCDLELLLNGAFSPLDGFLGRADYESVLDGLRLASGILCGRGVGSVRPSDYLIMEGLLRCSAARASARSVTNVRSDCVPQGDPADLLAAAPSAPAA